MARASNLALRLATAGVGVPVILFLLYKSPPWGFFALTTPASMMCAYELLSMTHSEDRIGRWFGALMTGVIASLVYFGAGDLRVVFTTLITIAIVGPLFVLIRLGDIRTAALRAVALSFAPLYTGIPLTLLALLRKAVPFEGSGYILLALGLAWTSDTGGYFAGRYFGKHKLYEAVSPKKTIEGSIGGLLAVMTWATIGHFTFLQGPPLVHLILLALVGGALSQAGDLAESVFKRSMGVKDSGQLLPGHGGILDRVDAVLLTAPVVFLYILWFPRLS